VSLNLAVLGTNPVGDMAEPAFTPILPNQLPGVVVSLLSFVHPFALKQDHRLYSCSPYFRLSLYSLSHSAGSIFVLKHRSVLRTRNRENQSVSIHGLGITRSVCWQAICFSAFLGYLNYHGPFTKGFKKVCDSVTFWISFDLLGEGPVCTAQGSAVL
jgi:hypothetical protein